MTKGSSAALFGALVSMAGVANAAPSLQIVDSGGALKVAPAGGVCTVGSATNCEVIGDPGGTVHPWPANAPGGGAGIPSAGAGWAVGPGFSSDPSFGPGAKGTSGWHASYLNMTTSGRVTFQFMGAGDSSFANSFWVNTGSGYTQIFQDGQASNPTNPCGVSGTAPVCALTSGGFPGQNQYTFTFGPGLIAFGFGINGAAPALFNDGRSNGDLGQAPGFFLGMDPYLAGGPWENIGKVAYVGLTDRPSTTDHDFQDMGVRISVGSVPEPASWAFMLAGFGLVGFTMRSRRTIETVVA
jgi:hypothetical protein